MDGTLINGRGIFEIASKKGFIGDLVKLVNDHRLEYYQRSIEIAKLSKGYKYKDFLEIFNTIPFQKNVDKVISNLHDNGFITAIATDSYQFLAESIKKRLNMNYAFGNNLIKNDGIITGELEIHNSNLTSDFISGRIYSICKSCVLEDLCSKHNVSIKDSIAVGDGIVDIGMIKKAGLGIAYNAEEKVNRYADVIIKNMEELLEYI
jgi:phosphoserine phosphatase